MKKIILISGFVFVVFMLFACQSTDKEYKQEYEIIETEITKDINVSIYSYGNGVYYFPSYNFGFILSRFITDNPSLKLVAITGDNTGGYYVIFRGK